MALIDQVRSEMMAAMKEKNTIKKEALSALLAALKSKAIDKRADLTAEEEIDLAMRIADNDPEAKRRLEEAMRKEGIN